MRFRIRLRRDRADYFEVVDIKISIALAIHEIIDVGAAQAMFACVEMQTDFVFTRFALDSADVKNFDGLFVEPEF